METTLCKPDGYLIAQPGAAESEAVHIKRRKYFGRRDQDLRRGLPLKSGQSKARDQARETLALMTLFDRRLAADF